MLLLMNAPSAKPPAAASHKGCFLVPVLAVTAGLFLTYWYMVKPRMERSEAEGWQETSAEVVNSRVVEAHSSRSFDYEPLVTYRYTYDGKEYESSRLAFASLMQPERSGARKIVDGYPKGKKITCYVDPEEPDQAVVQREREQDLRLQLLGPMLVAVSVVFFIMVARRKERQGKRSGGYS